MNIIQLSAIRKRNVRRRTFSEDPYADPVPEESQMIRRAIPNDERGIRFEIGKMVQYAEHFMSDPLVIKTARTVTQLCPAKDKTCEISALYTWAKNHMRYINDPDDIEVIATAPAQIADIHTPPELIEEILGPELVAQMMHYNASRHEGLRGTRGVIHVDRCFRTSGIGASGLMPRMSGDCDEGATFLASLLMAAAIPARYRFGGSIGHRDKPNWHHVWVQGQNENGDWIDMDITEPEQKLGWFFPAFQAFGHYPERMPA